MFIHAFYLMCSSLEDVKLFEIVYEVSMPFSMIYDGTP